MPGKKTRAFKAGQKTGEGLVELGHLMYNNLTRLRFFEGLMSKLMPAFKEAEEKRANG